MTALRPASIPGAVRRAMVAHARRDAPNECCGLLVGRGRRVDLAVPMANVDARPRTGFRIDPAEHLAVRRVFRRLAPALQVVGVYHSHPVGPATPSARDIREAHYPDWLFAIVGFSGRDGRPGCSGRDGRPGWKVTASGARRVVRVFQIRAGGVELIPVRWRPSTRRTYRP